MPVYEVAGLRFHTPFPVAELSETADGAVDWTVERVDALSVDAVEPVYELRTREDVLWATIGAGEGRFSLTFADTVAFAVDRAARRVTYVPRPGVDDSTLRHLLIDQVIPRLLAVDGALVLHASAVEVDGKAVAFVGPSGAGKSSLAAGYVRQGTPLLADDFLLLHPTDGGYLATAAYPGLRLWSDSAEFFAGPVEVLPTVAGYTDKRRWAPPPAAGTDGRPPLRAIVMLGDPPGPDGPVWRVGRLRGADAFMRLFQQTFRVDRPDRAARQAELDQLMRLAGTVPLLLLEYRRDYAVLPEVIAGLGAALAARG